MVEVRSVKHGWDLSVRDGRSRWRSAGCRGWRLTHQADWKETIVCLAATICIVNGSAAVFCGAEVFGCVAPLRADSVLLVLLLMAALPADWLWLSGLRCWRDAATYPPSPPPIPASRSLVLSLCPPPFFSLLLARIPLNNPHLGQTGGEAIQCSAPLCRLRRGSGRKTTIFNAGGNVTFFDRTERSRFTWRFFFFG